MNRRQFVSSSALASGFFFCHNLFGNASYFDPSISLGKGFQSIKSSFKVLDIDYFNGHQGLYLDQLIADLESKNIIHLGRHIFSYSNHHYFFPYHSLVNNDKGIVFIWKTEDSNKLTHSIVPQNMVRCLDDYIYIVNRSLKHTGSIFHPGEIFMPDQLISKTDKRTKLAFLEYTNKKGDVFQIKEIGKHYHLHINQSINISKDL